MEKAITGVVFSKDRAMQLDATLKSFIMCCDDFELINLKVLYTATSDFHFRQYEDLRSNYPFVDFVFEGNFCRDLKSILNIPVLRMKLLVFFFRFTQIKSNSFVLFLVDDAIFVRNFKLSVILQALQQEGNALGFSFLLGKNINYCYPLDINIIFPDYQPVLDNIIKYNWVNVGPGLNYPLEVSGSIYRKKDILGLLSILKFKNPNDLESQIANKAKLFTESNPELLCFNQSVSFCNPLNKVQNVYNNRAFDKLDYSTEQLAKLFEKGDRIDINEFYGFVPNAVHQECDLDFINIKENR